MITAVVCADNNWGIGLKGKRITNIPDDEKYIATVSSGQNIIMGRKTFDTTPARWHLQNSNIIVISRRSGFRPSGCTVVKNHEQALKAAKDHGGDIYIVGGERVFKELLDCCDEVRVTHVDYEYDCDAYFPNLDKKIEWVMIWESEEQTHFDTVYYFRRYRRRKLLEV